MTTPVRVVVVDDHAVVRESLELALLASGYVVPRPELPSGRDALAATIGAITGVRPDVALVDVDPGPSGAGLRLVAPLTRNGVKVVAMTSATPGGRRWAEAVRDGAASVHGRDRPLADVLTTVHRLATGRPVMTREERDGLVARWEAGGPDRRDVLARLDSLTGREAAVLGELLDGRPVRAIAARAGLSPATVRTQVKAVLTKLDVSTQLAAVGLAREVGWRPPPS